jgi:hypothetical protein
MLTTGKWLATDRVGVAGLRPAEPVAGGLGNPLRFPRLIVDREIGDG